MLSAILSVRAIHSHYGRAHILDGLSFEVGRGEVLALLGRNGAGKSTTFKTVVGIVRATGGEIEFMGQRLERRATHDIARLGLGYVPEERRIFTELTVMENLEVGRQPKRDGAPFWTPERLFEIFPNLAEMRDRPGGRMSGGEQQMLTIARTLMGNPLLVLLDEPSEGLAPVIVDQMARAIQGLKAEGLTVVLSEQNLRFATRVADRAVIIEKGTARFAGTMAALEADEQARAQYLMV